MKKITLLFTAICFLISGSYAQKDDRTTATRIADVLAQLPAPNETALNTAMKEMEALGEEGLLQLSKQLTPDGKADDSKQEYAVMGYTAYVSAPGRETLKKEAENAWIKALANNEDKNITSFFMSMLEIIGTDLAVPALTRYLSDKELAYKAAPVLASIGTAEAGKSLLTALTQGNAPAEVLLQAMGNMKYKAALDQINTYALNGTEPQKKAALYALAEIGDPSSENVLFQQTQENGQSFANKEATALYASYIQRLIENGHTTEAAGFANAFAKKAAKGNVFAKTAALNAQVLAQKEGALKALSKAAVDKNKEYRNAALAMAAPLVNRSNVSLFTKKLRKASPEVQVSLVNFLSNHPDASTLKTITKFAQGSKNAELKHAAILALAKNSDGQTTQTLLDILNKSTEADAASLKQALLVVKDDKLIPTILAGLPNRSGFQKALLLEVLASKKDKSAFEAVAAELSNSDEQVRNAALAALPEVAGAQSLPALFDMLQSTENEKDLPVIQKSLTAALENEQNGEEMVLQRLQQYPANKQHLLFPALSSIGSKNAMDMVYKSYQSNSGDKGKAVSALAAWPNANAMDVLYTIATEGADNKHKADALTGYISLIQKSQAPDEQKLLLLKKAMAAATTTQQKGRILDQTAQITTFPALAFAAGYLDDAALKQKAAAAVMNIGLSDKSFYGSLVREWLTKALNALDGQDAIYMKKSIQKFLDDMPEKEGFVSLFNGKDLTGWKGLVANPIKRSQMSEAQMKEAQAKADEVMRNGWVVKDGELVFLGKGDNIVTLKKYGDIEMFVDWKIYDDGHKEGDAGIYLRGTPQVQIWDTSRTNVGAEVGSGGLYNNQKYESKPLKVADNKLGEWNHFYIKMVGDKVTVYLNGELVTDNVPLENYWNRKMPLWPEEQIELQAHGSRIGYRDVYVKELENEQPFELSEEEKKEGYEVLFDGTSMDSWQGNLTDYVIENGEMVVRPKPGSRGNLFTQKEYGDFVFRFDFKLTEGANNGLGIRAPLSGDAAYNGMEIQILDNDADIYKNLEKYQYHGSVYGVIPAKRGFLKPVGEWNHQEVIVKGPKIQVILNGEKILDGDLTEARKKGTLDKKKHPGIFNEKGHIGFLGHGSVVHFRNIRVKEL